MIEDKLPRSVGCIAILMLIAFCGCISPAASENSGSNLERCANASINGTAREFCLAAAAGMDRNPEACMGINDSVPASWCAQLAATLTGNATVCALLGNSSTAEMCREYAAIGAMDPGMCLASGGYNNGCAMDIAQRAKNASICSYVTSDEEKGRCLRLASSAYQLSLGNWSFCSTVPGDEGIKCGIGAAVENGNNSYCDGLSGDWQNVCLWRIYADAIDVEGCASLDDPYRTPCLADAAAKSGRHEICAGIGDAGERAACHAAIAFWKNDVDECMLAGSPQEINYCYMKLPESASNEFFNKR